MPLFYPSVLPSLLRNQQLFYFREHRCVDFLRFSEWCKLCLLTISHRAMKGSGWEGLVVRFPQLVLPRDYTSVFRRLSPGVWLGERGGCGLPGILRDISRLLPGVVRAVGNGQSGALGFTSRSAVPVCYLGQVCFPLSACPSSCVTPC